uniref:GMP reductase n=1 Tax=Angiostrongylus cantonensis TaxID=6313 RepID=A0A158P9K1_ANGCA
MPRIENEPKLDFKDVLLRPKRSTLKSRSDVDLVREYVFRNSKKEYSGIPIIASNMDSVGTFEMAKALSAHKMFTTIHKHYTVCLQHFICGSNDVFNHIAVSSGISDSDFKKTTFASMWLMVTLNASSISFAKFARNFLCEMVEELILSGADIVKVGIGPGSVCTTRKKTGVGYPQLSATLECADAAHGLNGHVISDGGCTNPGDVAKAFGAGADFVMIGGLFAGHDQSGGKIIEKDGQKFKLFYGMSSDTAMKKHHGNVADYRASEGKTITIPYRGDVNRTVQDILGGLRSACTYTGAGKLKELAKRTTFIRVTQQTNDMYVPFEV